MPSVTFTTPQPEQIKELFTNITPKYDFLNGLLSMKIDSLWRKWAVRMVLNGKERSLLDIGTGTGQFLKAFLRKQEFSRVCAMDLCESMLEKAKQTVRSERVEWVNADVSKGIPVENASFDLATAAFTLRSLNPVLPSFFKEVHRVLAPGGKVAFLELTRPTNFFLKFLYYPYLKVYLPLVGALVSGSTNAYSFLANSILHFDEPVRIKEILRGAGFAEVETFSYTGGIATLILGRKK